MRCHVAQGRGDGERVRDPLQIATEARLVELESEGVCRHVFEPMRLVDDDVLGLRQQRAAHPRVL